MAGTVYIRDTLYVPLRGGQSPDFRILHKGIKSGTALEQLEINPDTGYSLVRMADGLEGWVQTQYLVDTPIAADQLQKTNRRLKNLQSDYDSKLEQLATLQQTLENLTNTNDELQANTESLQEELDQLTTLSANVITINEENKQLHIDQESILAQLDTISVANEALEDTSNRDWFLRGAGTLLIGLLFGFWVSRSLYQKRNTGGWG